MDANSWSDLNGDVLDCIIHKLDFVDFFRFSATCRSWHSSAQIHSNCCSVCPKARTPWLLFSSIADIDNERIKPYLSFYDITSTKYDIHVASILSNIVAVMGSSNGFLVVLDLACDIHIINPISGAHYPLPRIKLFDYPNNSFLKLCRSKVVLNICSATNLTFSVALLYDDMIYLIDSGETSWSELTPIDILDDAIFYKGELHLMCPSGTYAIDLNTLFEIPTNLHFKHRDYPWSRLVKSPNDDLFLVIQIIVHTSQIDRAYYVTEGFEVYKYDDTQVRWDKVNDFGEFALFAGSNAFFFLPTSNCSINVTKNNICFKGGDSEYAGVFDLVDGTIKWFELDIDLDWNDLWTAFWFTPTLA